MQWIDLTADTDDTGETITRDTVASTRTVPGVFLAASQRAPLLALLQGLERGEPLIVITGEAGVGKTALLESALPEGETGGTQRIWHRGKDEKQLTRARVLSEIAAQGRPGEAPGNVLAGQSGQCRRTILIIDDAHLLTPEAIGTLIGILDSARAGSGQLQLVLVGRPMLWNRLRRADAVDRVKVAGQVTGLPPSEAREYLRERLEATGTQIDDILTEDARLALLSRPRWTLAELNAILSNVGPISVGQGEGRITHEAVARAASPPASAGAGHRRDTDPAIMARRANSSPPPRLRPPARPVRRAAMAAAALLAILAAGALYRSRVPNHADRLVAERASPKPDVSPVRVPASPPAASASSSGRPAPTTPIVPAPLFAASKPELPQTPAPSLVEQQPQNAAPALGAVAAAHGAAPVAVGALPSEPPNAAAGLAPKETAPASVPLASAEHAAPPEQVDTTSQRPALTMPAAEIDELLERGEAMLARGDIVSARVLYKRAALANSGIAATILGKTYDPVFLAGIGATAIKPAPSSAAAWYLRAAELGDKEAQDRLLQLRSRASQVAGND